MSLVEKDKQVSNISCSCSGNVNAGSYNSTGM